MNENNDKKDVNEIPNNPAINSSLNEENINNRKRFTFYDCDIFL